MALPSDPVILLSYVNTKLRDQYASLEQFCDAENVDSETVCRKLATINYVYNEETNSFQQIPLSSADGTRTHSKFIISRKFVKTHGGFMASPTRFIFQGGQGEIVEKRSRFIATVAPVSTEEEAQAFIERVKKQYWDARHNCSAMIVGEHGEITRCSDDGEPPHTAGRPMLDVLLGEGLQGVCVVVTRYFGGILLGTGGLVRAYQAAVAEGLRHCQIAEQKTAIPVKVRTDYTGVGKLLYLAGSGGYPVLSTDYTDIVTAELLLPPEALSSFEAAMQEATAGKAIIEKDEPVLYAVIDGEVMLL